MSSSDRDDIRMKDFKVPMPAMSPPPRPPPPSAPQANLANNTGVIAVFSYCAASILMTVTNKYVVSGGSGQFNLNFFLLCIQSVVCVIAIETCKRLNIIQYRDFKMEEAKKWFPISLLLVIMIYTGSKSLQYLSIPVYTIFKNLTIIMIAYGEVLWFGGSVTGMALFSFGLMVLSSVVAAWADIQSALESFGHNSSEAAAAISTLNAGYLWMILNCTSTTAYILSMRKRIKVTQFKDFDTMFYNNLLSIPILIACTFLLEDWSSENLLKNFPLDTRNTMIFAMVISGTSTVFISYTSAWCVRVTSSTTYSMAGALNKLPLTVAGIIFFAAPVTFFSVTAIIIGFVAGIVYTMAKFKQRNQNSGLPTSASSASLRDGLRKN